MDKLVLHARFEVEPSESDQQRIMSMLTLAMQDLSGMPAEQMNIETATGSWEILVSATLDALGGGCAWVLQQIASGASVETGKRLVNRLLPKSPGDRTPSVAQDVPAPESRGISLDIAKLKQLDSLFDSLAGNRVASFKIGEFSAKGSSHVIEIRQEDGKKYLNLMNYENREDAENFVTRDGKFSLRSLDAE